LEQQMKSPTEHRVHIGEVIRNAVVFNFRGKPGDEMNTDTLLETVARLFRLLSERRIEYALAGGVALLQYVEGRNTEDIDLVLAPSSLDRLPEIQIVSKDVDFARGNFGDVRVDLLLTSNSLFETVRQSFVTTQNFVEQEIPCATVEGLLLMKMYALPSLYRQGSFARVGLYENDIATLVHDYKPDIEPLLEELGTHLSATDLDEVRGIISEISERIERFEEGSSRR
jgi:hypothetical protein